MSFEESLCDGREAERIRIEATLEKLSPHQLALRHGLPIKVIQAILNNKIHSTPEAPAVDPRTGWDE